MAEEMIEMADLAVEEMVELTLEKAIESAEIGYIEKMVEGALASAIQDSAFVEITSFTEAAIEKVASKLITKELVLQIGVASGATIAGIIASIINKISVEAANMLQADLDEINKAMKHPAMVKLLRLKQWNDWMKSGGSQPKEPPDACRVLDEMKKLGEDVEFTVFALIFDGVEIGFSYMDIIPEKQLEDLMTHPLLAPYARDILSSFNEIGTIVQGSNVKYEMVNQPAMLRMTKGEATLLKKCRFSPIPYTNVYNVDGSSIDKRSKSWVKFWGFFFNITRNNGCTKECFILEPVLPMCPKSGIVGGHLELARKNNYWYMLPICKSHNAKTFDRGGQIMKTKENAFAIQMPIHPNYSQVSAQSTTFATAEALTSTVSVDNILDKFVGMTLQKVLPSHIKQLMDKVRIAVKDACDDTKAFAKKEIAYIKYVPSLSYPTMLIKATFLYGLKGRCTNYLHNRVNAKLQAINFEVDLASTRKEVKSIKKSKEWKTDVKSLTDVAKQYSYMCPKNDKSGCVVC